MRDFHRKTEVSDLSQVGEARRAIELDAKAGGFEEEQRGKLAILSTEIAANIARHSGGGELLSRLIGLPAGLSMELIGIDRGPGMQDSGRCMSDGYSTAGTSGNGLGAISRQADEFDLYSSPKDGTVIMARIRAAKKQPVESDGRRPEVRFAGISVPYPGEQVCGDAWRVQRTENGFAVIVCDGLGHGPHAAEASQAALAAFDAAPDAQPLEMIEHIDKRLHGTRGAAVAVASFDSRGNRLRYSGIGNISGCLVSGATRRGLTTLNGTAGAHVGAMKQFDYDWPVDATLIMHSDGLQTRWDVGRYPGLPPRHPAVIAGTLYRDYRRRRDDAAIVAVQQDRTSVPTQRPDREP